MLRFALALALALLLPTLAHADPLRVVCSGDSISVGYCPSLRAALESAAVVPVPWTVPGDPANTARGGMKAPHFVGAAAWPDELPEDYRAHVLAADPDVVVVTLGVNDAFHDSQAPANWPAYVARMSEAFDSFEGFRNGRGFPPVVLVTALLPVDVDAYAAYRGTYTHLGVNDRIEGLYNPWIAAEAAARGLVFVDLWTSIQSVPDWSATLISIDGLHPSTAGREWIAGELAAEILPEPATGAGLTSALALLAWLARRRSAGVWHGVGIDPDA